MKEEFDPVLSVLNQTHEASLGTTDGEQPYVSATGFLFEPKGNLGEAHLLLSDLAKHTQNIKKHPKISLLVVHHDEDVPIHTRRRVTLTGVCAPLMDEVKAGELKKKYLRIFPHAERFFELADFKFYEMEVLEINYYGGYGKARTYR